MSSRIQTTIDSNASSVIVIAHPSVFTTEVTKGIASLHLTPVLIAPERVGEFLVDQRQKKIFSEAYACLWIDLPLFTDQRKKIEQGREVLIWLRESLHIPLIYICFDPLYVRKNGAQGDVPTHGASTLFSTVKQSSFPTQLLAYQHVIYPFEGGLSVALRFLLEKIAQGNDRPFTDDWTPIWYVDVIAHIMTCLSSAQTTSGVFTGSEQISLKEFEVGLRRSGHFPKISAQPLAFPFSFTKGIGVTGQGMEHYIDDLALRIPKPNSTKATDIPQRKVFSVEKKKKPARIRKRMILGKTLLAAGTVMIALYIAITAYFFGAILHYRNVIEQVALANTGLELRQIIEKPSLFHLSYVRTISTHVPLPYSLLGLDLHPEGVLAGIDSSAQLLGGIEKYQSVEKGIQENLGSLDHLRTLESNNTSLLDESTKDLASIQAQISQRDLIFDALYGVDGLSDQLFQSILRLREEVSQTRVLLLVLNQLSGQKKTTVAMVSLDTTTARPLIGVPTQVLVAQFDQGKLLTSQEYTVSELDTLLRGRVDFPEELRGYLPQDAQWKLADGSWSIDGPTSARQIAWFLNKQLKTDIDLGFFFDSKKSESIRPLIRALTPNTPLAESSTHSTVLGIQTINRTIFGKERGVEPSSTTQDFQHQLFSELSQSEILVYARDNDVATALKTIGWDGSVTTPSCPTAFGVERSCRVSTRYLAEYDLGSNQQGSIEKENQVHTVQFSSNSIIQTDSVLFPKTSVAGRQKLLKYSIDPDARNISVFVNGIQRILEDNDIGQEFSKTTLSLLIDLQTEEKTVVTLQYTTTAVEPKNSSFVFFAQKQAGKESDPFTLDLKVGSEYSPKIIAPAGNIGKNDFSFSTQLDQSRVFAIGF